MVITSFRDEHAWLSNFWPCKGFVGPTLEHEYQAGKFAHLPALYDQCRRLDQAGATKRFASKHRRETRKDWHAIKFGVMWTLICRKFSIAHNPDLVRLLLGTGDARLIERNWWHDRTWGMCSCAGCDGRGANMLGLMLMERRDLIRGVIND